MSQQTIHPDDVPRLVKEALVAEYGAEQERCVRGYFPSQALSEVMEYLGPEQIQIVRGTRSDTETADSPRVPAFDLPNYVTVGEQISREMSIDFDRARDRDFEWDVIQDFLVDSDLTDVAISKLVFRMDNPELRDHLFTLLQNAINYPSSYKSEFTDRFYFVMESQKPELQKDYDNIQELHEQGYLADLGWNHRTLDLMAMWTHYGWTKCGNTPLGVTQHEIEELAFNQRRNSEPIFTAVNTKLVVNRWRTPFGRGLTDMRAYDWETRQGWVPIGDDDA